MNTSNNQSWNPFARPGPPTPEGAALDLRGGLKEAEEPDESSELEEDDLADESRESASRSSVKFVEVDEKYYNRIGFYCAVDSVNDHRDNYKKALAGLDEEARTRIQQVTDIYNRAVEHINKRIAEREARLKEEHDNLANHRAQLKSLREERDKIFTKMEEIKEKLLAAYIELANKKKSLLDGRLDARFEELKNELKRLMESSQLLAEKKHELNEQIYEDNKEVFEDRVKRFTEVKNKAEKAYEIIREKIEALRQVGITHNVVYFLLNVAGVAGVIAAGWFYSVFILKSELGSEDYFSFFLRRIISFGDAKFKDLGNPLGMLAIFVGVLLGLLLLISGVVWICEWLISKKEKIGGSAKTELTLNLNEDGKVSYYSRINARSLYEIWLQLVPFVLIVGLTFILISLFGPQNQGKDLENLLSSLEGQFIGAIIALVATGIMVLYISRIIEPRLLHPAESKPPSFKWARHWELVTGIILFSVLMCFVLFSSKANLADALGLNAPIAIAFFWVIVLFTAFTLGYGIKYRGLHRDARYLEKSLRDLSREIEINSRPHPLDLESIQSEEFRQKFEKIHENFFKIIMNRNEGVVQLYGGESSSISKNDGVSSSPKKSKKLFFWKRGNEEEKQPASPQPAHAYEIDNEMAEKQTAPPLPSYSDKIDDKALRKYLPKEMCIVDNLYDELRAKRVEVEEIKTKIKAIEIRKGEIEEVIAKAIKAHEDSLRKLRSRLLHNDRAWHKLRNGIELRRKIDEGRIKDGYDLGLLFHWKMAGELHDTTRGE